MPTPPIIEIRNVRYTANGTADGVTIIDDVSWRIEQGQHWALLGRNGSGKTTLLKIACGYTWPNQGGEVLRNGKRMTDLRTLRRSIGWVTSILNTEIPRGERALDTVVSGRFAQTGLKNLNWERPTPGDYTTAEQCLVELNAAGIKDRRFGILSQGEQQMVLLARARMAQPLLLVLDEPCAGLDPGAREQFLAGVEALASAAQSPSIVMVTHHIEEITPSLTHVLVMQDGRVIENGPTDQILSQALVEQLYDTKLRELVLRDGRHWPIW